jgi:hypothetical protein
MKIRELSKMLDEWRVEYAYRRGLVRELSRVRHGNDEGADAGSWLEANTQSRAVHALVQEYLAKHQRQE